MNFKQAFKLMKEGNKIKLPSWGGYWCWENDTIMMYCKDGKVLDVRETETVDYTFSNITSDEWVLADESNTPILGGVATFNFGEAIKYLKRGLRVARKGWNGKDMWLTLMKIYTHTKIQYDENNAFNLQPFIAMKTVDGKLVPWSASQTDMLAEDYIFVD